MRILAAILLASLCAGAQTQPRHDPMNDREVDQMRGSAQQPQQRIELLIAFSRERILAVERLRGASRPAPDDPAKIADLLGDLAALIDELDDNLDMYNFHGEDLRRPLRHVLDAEAEFLQELKAVGDSATPARKRRFAVALKDASDALQASTEAAREMLASQLEKKGEEKNKQKLDRREAQSSR